MKLHKCPCFEVATVGFSLKGMHFWHLDWMILDFDSLALAVLPQFHCNPRLLLNLESYIIVMYYGLMFILYDVYFGFFFLTVKLYLLELLGNIAIL